MIKYSRKNFKLIKTRSIILSNATLKDNYTVTHTQKENIEKPVSLENTWYLDGLIKESSNLPERKIYS